MKKLLIQNKSHLINFICILLSAALLVFCAVALYDMQTSEGIGLYLALKAGSDDRRLYDLLAVLVEMICLLAAIVVPCILCRCLRPAPFFRLLCGYLALVPGISVASLIHIVAGTLGIELREALINGDVLWALKDGLADTVPALLIGLPLLMLLAAAVKEESGIRPGKGWIMAAAMQVVLAVLTVLYPVLASYTAFLLHYVLLLECFVVWEKLFARYPALNEWGWILFGGCFLRGIYVLTEVMNRYHI